MMEKSWRLRYLNHLAENVDWSQKAKGAIGTHFSPENVRWKIEPDSGPSDVPQITAPCDSQPLVNIPTLIVGILPQQRLAGPLPCQQLFPVSLISTV